MSEYINIYKQSISQIPVGYCCCKAHPGALTTKIMKNHKCLRKCCNHLIKNENHQYWEERRLKKELARTKKKLFNQLIYAG